MLMNISEKFKALGVRAGKMLYSKIDGPVRFETVLSNGIIRCFNESASSFVEFGAYGHQVINDNNINELTVEPILCFSKYNQDWNDIPDEALKFSSGDCVKVSATDKNSFILDTITVDVCTLYNFESGEILKLYKSDYHLLSKFTVFNLKRGDFFYVEDKVNNDEYWLGIYDEVKMKDGNAVLVSFVDSMSTGYFSVWSDSSLPNPGMMNVSEIKFIRPATKIEKQSLLEVCGKNGWCWDAYNKTMFNKDLVRTNERTSELYIAPFTKVIKRRPNGVWSVDFFSHFGWSTKHQEMVFCCVGGDYRECVLYNNETAYLIGSVLDCPEKFIIKKPESDGKGN